MNRQVRVDQGALETLGTVVPLTERNGAPRHVDDKTYAVVKAAVESALSEQASKFFEQMSATNANLERAVNRLLENIEGVVLGEHDVAVASVVDTEEDDLPRLSSVKANVTVLYNVKAKGIAEQLGLSLGTVSYLLNSQGLDWPTRKPDLWDRTNYKLSGVRLWHRSIVKLLRNVILNPDHEERRDVSAACERALQRASATIQS